MYGRALVVRRDSKEPLEFAIRDLSAVGARLVGRAPLVDGERLSVRFVLDGAEATVVAEVVRTERQNAQVAVVFRDASPAAIEAIERAVSGVLARVRTGSPVVVVLGVDSDALARDLAHLGRATHRCETALEVMSALSETSRRYEAVIVASALGADLAGSMFHRLAADHPHIRRILMFGEQLTPFDHDASRRVHAILRTPLRARALARALGIEAVDSSLAMLPAIRTGG